MRITLKARNMTLTPAISEYAEKKIGSLSKFINAKDTSAIADIEVERASDHHQGGEQAFQVEVNLHIAKHQLRAEASHQDLYAAIDVIKDDLARELKTAQKKKIVMERKGGQKIKKILKSI
jgi:putative sigma-54 modulation protein